jgi:hypothetical protein
MQIVWQRMQCIARQIKHFKSVSQLKNFAWKFCQAARNFQLAATRRFQLAA